MSTADDVWMNYWAMRGQWGSFTDVTCAVVVETKDGDDDE